MDMCVKRTGRIPLPRNAFATRFRRLTSFVVVEKGFSAALHDISTKAVSGPTIRSNAIRSRRCLQAQRQNTCSFLSRTYSGSVMMLSVTDGPVGGVGSTTQMTRVKEFTFFVPVKMTKAGLFVSVD